MSNKVNKDVKVRLNIRGNKKVRFSHREPYIKMIIF
ncbi:hypothetical protein SAMN00777080_3663 [Aquiflexum balticum DSM 16537]|uniref:Uncharacterized protein n=1 Tax=Aquiflexum balticum DSM 16537 TaxID=758820 RepID=A0A1W2H887_9BACT|nr:hypothetical protein SAMN00777080_3663 [Aquiflexum balticum DSM 16537]